MKPLESLASLKDFLSKSQFEHLFALTKFSEEREHFQHLIMGTADLVKEMPVTYEQNGEKDPVVFLHYFLHGSDWYITEKDIEGGVDQAFGYAILNGDLECAEWGYISIRELVENGVEMDLYFAPRKFSELKIGN